MPAIYSLQTIIHNIADGDIDGWEKTLDHIMTFDVDKIIPGHGPLSSKKDVSEMKDYVLAFDETAKKLTAISNDFEQILAEMKKTLPQRAEFESIIGGNIQMRYMKQQ